MATEPPLDADACLRLLLSHLPAALWTTDADLRITSTCGSALEHLGLASEGAIGRGIHEYLGPDESSATIIAMHRSALAGQAASGSVQRAERNLQCRVQPLFAAGGGVTGTVGLAFEGTTTERARRRESALTTLWRLVGRQDLDHRTLSHAILVEGGRALGLERGSVVHVDGDLCAIDYLENFGDPALYAGLPLRESAAQLVLEQGRTFSSMDLQTVERARARRAVTAHHLRTYIGASFRVGRRNYVLSFASSAPRATPFDEEDHTYVELLAGFFSRHLLTRQQQEWIVELASIDPLTGLPNRTYFSRYISDRVANGADTDARVAVLAIGLDRFKHVNSSLGHSTGDRILLETGSRLRGILSDDTVLARLGDDEFAALLPHPSTRYAVEYAARRICRTLAEPYVVGEEQVHLSASVGAVISNGHIDAEELLLQADVAMHRAKDDGRNRFRFYSDALAAQVSRRRHLETGLRRALEAQEFTLVYQPFVNLVSHAVVGAEALIRWNRPGIGVAAPAEFIGLAEESGLIIPIGAWALATACLQAKRWNDAGKALRVTVNISARQLQDPQFLSDLDDVLGETGADPTTIGLEVTESVAITDLLTTRRVLQHCRDLGLRIALDDFGTSYSSLAYIRELPIDMLKVDRRFVEGLPTDRTAAAIARAIIAFSTSLGFDTLAEGIETEEQESWLAREGCRIAQGFLFAKPMAVDAFEQWLERWPHRSTLV
ncbi:EAL domain-containing protein [bacterium]|nr:MAG: EAL domain-containing protein [bacterium]